MGEGGVDIKENISKFQISNLQKLAFSGVPSAFLLGFSDAVLIYTPGPGLFES